MIIYFKTKRCPFSNGNCFRVFNSLEYLHLFSEYRKIMEGNGNTTIDIESSLSDSDSPQSPVFIRKFLYAARTKSLRNKKKARRELKVRFIQRPNSITLANPFNGDYSITLNNLISKPYTRILREYVAQLITVIERYECFNTGKRFIKTSSYQAFNYCSSAFNVKTYTTIVYINNMTYGFGTGLNTRTANERAARYAFRVLLPEITYKPQFEEISRHVKVAY